MPIYAYRCETCQHQADVLQKISDALLTICPACAAATFKKQVTAAGFQLKGSGWYATDFRNNSSNATPAKNSHESESSTASDQPTETKSAATAASSTSGSCAGSCACH